MVAVITFPPPVTLELVLGFEAFVLGVMLFVFGRRITARVPAVGDWLPMLRILAIVLGMFAVANGVLGDATPDSGLANPVADTVQSVTVGADLYQATCAACHGAAGYGDGPLAGTTRVRPPSFRGGHIASHKDGDLFYWIGAGLPGGMPAWSAKLSETDRWNLVNYLRSLNGQGPTAVPVAPSQTPAGSSVGLVGIPVSVVGALGWLATGLRSRRRRPRTASLAARRDACRPRPR